MDKWKKVMSTFNNMMNDKARRREIVLYLIIGILTTLVNLLVFGVFTLVYPSGKVLLPTILWFNTPLYWYYIASILAWIAAVVFAYAGNKLYVFQTRNLSRNALLKEITSFFGARVLSLLIFDLAGLSLCIQVFGMKDFTAKLVMNVLVIIFNYMASKLVIFKKKEQ